MKMRQLLHAVPAAILVLVGAPSHATDSHDYAKDEYAIIRDGLAPDRHVALATHADPEADGQGEGRNFHVWLMAEPAHRRIEALDDIGSNNILDTGPDAYRAAWSADSRHVAVSFRSDRHDRGINLYSIARNRARLVLGPSLFREVSRREIGSPDDLRESLVEIEWRGDQRFLLRERRLLRTRDTGLAKRLGGYGREKDKDDDGRVFVEFSAEGYGMLMPGNRYRIVDLKVGKFGE